MNFSLLVKGSHTAENIKKNFDEVCDPHRHKVFKVIADQAANMKKMARLVEEAEDEETDEFVLILNGLMHQQEARDKVS